MTLVANSALAEGGTPGWRDLSSSNGRSERVRAPPVGATTGRGCAAGSRSHGPRAEVMAPEPRQPKSFAPARGAAPVTPWEQLRARPVWGETAHATGARPRPKPTASRGRRTR